MAKYQIALHVEMTVEAEDVDKARAIALEKIWNLSKKNEIDNIFLRKLDKKLSD